MVLEETIRYLVITLPMHQIVMNLRAYKIRLKMKYHFQVSFTDQSQWFVYLHNGPNSKYLIETNPLLSDMEQYLALIIFSSQSALILK